MGGKRGYFEGGDFAGGLVWILILIFEWKDEGVFLFDVVSYCL